MPMDGHDGLSLRPVDFTFSFLYVQEGGSRAGRARSHGGAFLRINSHPLAQAALHIRPFFPRTFHAAPEGCGAFFFCFAEILNQTHFISPFVLMYLRTFS